MLMTAVIASMSTSERRVAPAAGETFPLSVHGSGRYLVGANGQPFLIHGDTAWAIAGQLTNAEITTYLEDRAGRGFNTILFSAPEAYYTSQSPTYNNVDGVAPFSPATSFTNPVTAYWNRVDHIVNSAKALGIACIINPCYLGYPGGSDGWRSAMNSVSNANLQAYGAFLANRYTQGNVIWSMGGDDDNNTVITKQWNVVTGIRSVRTTDIITAHPIADDANADDAYTYWSGFTGFNLNWIYGWPQLGFYPNALGAQGYSRGIPFLAAEFQYEQEGSPTINAAQLRYQSYGGMLTGACGQLFGNSPIWHFESPNRPFSYSGTWESNLDSTGSQQQAYFKTLFSAYQWWRLEPKTDTSLVTGSLSSGATRIYPALASDGTFAMIYVPSSQTISVNTNALAGVSGNVRIRRWSVTAGTWTTINASVAKTSSQSVATGAEGVIVIEGA